MSKLWSSAVALSEPASHIILATRGWDDVMLMERDELTSGSTWHAAGLLPLVQHGSYPDHAHLHKYSVDFYKTLEAETGLNAGFSVVGNLRMAQTQRPHGRIYALCDSTAETVAMCLMNG